MIVGGTAPIVPYFTVGKMVRDNKEIGTSPAELPEKQIDLLEICR